MTEVDDKSKSEKVVVEEETNDNDELEVFESMVDNGLSDTMMTQGFVPTSERYTPTNDSKFSPVQHPIRLATGQCLLLAKIGSLLYILTPQLFPIHAQATIHA